jgi:hypothetical protein
MPSYRKGPPTFEENKGISGWQRIELLNNRFKTSAAGGVNISGTA